MLLGTVPVEESTVSQIGSELVSTVKNGAGTVEELNATSAKPGVPVPLTNVILAVAGVATKVVGLTTCRFTVKFLTGPGALSNRMVPVVVEPAAALAQGETACTVKLTAVLPAVPQWLVSQKATQAEHCRWKYPL